MTDYAAAPIQPIANLVLNPANLPVAPGVLPGSSPLFQGRGVKSVGRTVSGAAAGDFTITLDPGLPGDIDLFTGAGYTLVTQRGTLGALPGGTTITQVAVTYPTIFTVRLVFSVASVGTDPTESDVIIWRSPFLAALGTPIPPPPPPPPPPPVVDLASAGQFTILAKTAISNVPTSSVVGTSPTGNTMGISPAAASFITDFALVLDGSGQFSTSAQVTGHVLAADYAAPTPALLTTAVLDMQAAYTAANALPPTVVNLNAGNIGGFTLPPGVYKFTTGITIPTDLTLNGGPNDSWVFQIAGTLNQGNAVTVHLTGGAQAKNVFWTTAGVATLGTTAVGVGIYLGQTQIVLQTGASVNGQLYAQSQVTLDHSTVTHT